MYNVVKNIGPRIEQNPGEHQKKVGEHQKNNSLPSIFGTWDETLEAIRKIERNIYTDMPDTPALRQVD